MKEKLLIATDMIIASNDKILLVKRGREPFKDYFALPGGMLERNETLRECVKREVLEETGLKVNVKKLLGIYDDPFRDPRGRVISVCYVGEAVSGKVKAGSDVKEVRWFDLNKVNFKLAFDHRKILEDYKKWKKGQLFF